MEVKDLRANMGNVDLVLEVAEKEEPRTFEKFGKSGRVCNAKVKDASGEVKLTLWNEDVDKVNSGDKIHLQNGWCSEFKGEKQISAGKFGKIEIVEQSTVKPGTNEVFTNDPGVLAGSPLEGPEEESQDNPEEPEIDEELIE